MKFQHHKGFTIIEMVVVIILVSVLAALGGQFITSPLSGLLSVGGRIALVDAADVALLRLVRDVRRALPNSLVVTGGTTLQLMTTSDGARYRAGGPGGDADQLDFSAADGSFNTYTRLATGGATNPRLAIYPLGQAGANPFADPVVTPATSTVDVTAAPVTVAGATEFRVTINPPHLFPLESPQQRVFLVDDTVTYTCAGNQLTRNGALLAEFVQACTFQYTIVNARNGLLTATLVLADAGEQITLTRQILVNNSP